MIKFFLPLLIVLQLSVCAQAQFLNLKETEIKKLQQLTGDDKTAAKRFAALEKLADSALNDAPRPVETISTEGRLQGDPVKTATRNALSDVPKMYALAVCFRLKNDEGYLKKASEFLTAWAKTNRPTGDPIDETAFDGIFESFDAIKNRLSEDDKSVIQQWFRAIAQAEINSLKKAQSKNATTSFNNWNSHRLKIIGEVAWCLNDNSLKSLTINELKTQLNANLNPDGTSFDFLERDALHYHTYDLEPLLKLAVIIKKDTGQDFYFYETAKHASIAKSVDFLIPFLNGEKTHPEYVHSKVAFDFARARNNEKGHEIGALFDPKAGEKVISLAAWFRPELTETVRLLANNRDKFPDWQSVLNEVTRPN